MCGRRFASVAFRGLRGYNEYWFTGPGFPKGMTGAFSASIPEMPDPAVAALANDPNAKVLVFVDGQNLYKTCQQLFGHPLCHPHLLAQ